mgnify:CR=1 FL=1
MSQKPIARLSDQHSCPVKGNGTTPIVQVAGRSTCDGRPVATIGDKTGCGATIIQGSSVAKVDGRPVAYLGCSTDHGGRIISASATQKVEP